MDSELIKKIMKVYINQLEEEENGAENIDLNHVYYHLASINPKLKYHWICTECIKTHGVNCDPIIQENNNKIMKKLIKYHKADENHKLSVAYNIERADPEYKKQYEEYLNNNKEQLEEMVRNFYL